MKADMWPILPFTTMSIPFIEMPQREEALPSITEKAAAAGGAGILAGVALHDHRARHHVLRHARPGAAVDDDRRRLVHAGAVIADASLDLDADRRVDADRDGVPALRVEDEPVALVGPFASGMQSLVEVAKRGLGKIDRGHQRSQK